MPEAKDIAPVFIDENTLKDKIYIIRGQQVMLDLDLAEIYGYTTSAFNQQVKRNIDRFPEDFIFQLMPEEIPDSLKSQNVILNESGNRRGMHTKKMPNAFTEQGIYMLMTVLRGPLAIQQSKALIRLFKRMKDLFSQATSLHEFQSMALLSEQTQENKQAISKLEDNQKDLQLSIAHIQTDLIDNYAELEATKAALTTTNEALEKSTNTLSAFMASFGKAPFMKEYVIHKGQALEADIVYQEIYGLAKKRIYVVDNYIGPKTLQHLRAAPPKVTITIFSDNLGKGLTSQELTDFRKEYPDIALELRATNNTFHDRFIVLDYDLASERVFHSGTSSKDAGARTSFIYESSLPHLLHPLIEDLITNPALKLT